MKTNEMPIQDLLLVITITRMKLIIDLLNIQTDIAVEVHHVIIKPIEVLHHKTCISLIPEADTIMVETLLHKIIDLDMTIIDEINAYIVLKTDFQIDHTIDAIPVLDMDHFHIQNTDHFNKTLLHTDPIHSFTYSWTI